MGLFGRKKKKAAAEAEKIVQTASEAVSGTAETAEVAEEKPEKEIESVLDKLSEYDRACIVFGMQLLFREPVEPADAEKAKEIFARRCEGIEQVSPTLYAVPRLAQESDDGKKVPPMFMLSDCFEIKDREIDAMTRSQMWACARHDEILDGCKYSIVATDMMAYGLSAKDRANMLMDFLEGLMELYPTCEAVLFGTSNQLMERTEILELCETVDRDDRFILITVNCRYFRIEGTEDMLVDSLGMGVLSLPDVQYHFHGLEPNKVVSHARNVLLYIYENDCPIKGGDTIDGIDCDGREEGNVWRCQFEDSLLEPKRPLMDICPGKFASGNRESSAE